MRQATKQAALDRAIDDPDSLVLFYQPIHELRSRQIVAAEALLRQRRRDGEVRSAKVISEAAEVGSRDELFTLDSWTIDTAYRAAASWQHDGAPEVRLNVNLSPREFQEGDVVARLTKLTGGCGIDPKTINLEITETSYIDHPKETMKILQELKTYGPQLWLDDFGTGHSSITHLQHFPLDGIKIAGHFVKDIAGDPRCRIIIAALVKMAHDMGMAVIAEGIEDEQQLEFLAAQECDYIQGFLYSRPMPEQDFRALLRAQIEE
ncbi:MAG TPA: EAL domain-containing protein [Thermoanaerobaculia bacterium]|nr:EAL domain-containing protein [Thermoanaerobaculia bacterium]